MESTEPRRILHMDMDAFYASVEVLDYPTLRGKPLLVGGTSGRGVVCAASYEARKFGCRSAMPMTTAMRLCPQALVRKPRFDRYHELSDRVFEILGRVSPVIEPLSLDEAFVDLTGTGRLLGDAVHVARRLKQAVRQETGLTASVGVAPNKFLAKLASDLDKPDGLTVMLGDEIERRLPGLEVGRIWGIGPKTGEKLKAFAIHTIAQLRQADDSVLKRVFGDEAQRYLDLAWGRDERAVVPDREAKSIGQERTFGEDLTDLDEMRQALLANVESVAGRLRRHQMTTRTVSIKLRYGDFRTISRQTTLKEATDVTKVIWESALGLLEAWASRQFAPLRLLGVQVGDLDVGGEQLQLFGGEEQEKEKKVDKAVDAIRNKFGGKAIFRGGRKAKPDGE